MASSPRTARFPSGCPDFNAAKSPDAAHGAAWMAVNAAPDAPPLRTLPFDPARPRDFLALYKASPFGQSAQFDFAGELVTRDRLGAGNDLDLVCLVDGSAGLLGYETGGRSPLMRQMLLQLDRRLESLLGQLGRAVGENGFNLVVMRRPRSSAGTRRRPAARAWP